MTPSASGFPDLGAAAERYAAFWAGVTPKTAGELRAMARRDLHFKDPLNDLVGVDAVVGLIGHMFASIALPAIRFDDAAFGERRAFYAWTFTGEARIVGRAHPVHVEGVSVVSFDGGGLVAEHHNHWDAGRSIFEHVPLLGGLLRRTRRRLSYDQA